jgi:hypothetical protein
LSKFTWERNARERARAKQKRNGLVAQAKGHGRDRKKWFGLKTNQVHLGKKRKRKGTGETEKKWSGLKADQVHVGQEKERQ